MHYAAGPVRVGDGTVTMLDTSTVRDAEQDRAGALLDELDDLIQMLDGAIRAEHCPRHHRR